MSRASERIEQKRMEIEALKRRVAARKIEDAAYYHRRDYAKNECASWLVRAPVQAQGVAQLSGNSGELADSNFPESDGISRAQGVAQSSLPPLPTPSWARDMHGETEVYTALEMQDYARAALAKAQPVSAELLDAAQGLIEILDNYPNQLVPINRKSVTVKALRAAIAALTKEAK